MEKSHWRAKSIYMRHTQHGGGKERQSALLQMIEWEYRMMVHRLRLAALNEARAHIKAAREKRRRRFRLIWESSVAPEAHAEWRSKMQRVGRVWKPIAEMTDDEVDEFVNESSTLNESNGEKDADSNNIEEMEAAIFEREQEIHREGLELEAEL
jgi:hypothetical protein